MYGYGHTQCPIQAAGLSTRHHHLISRSPYISQPATRPGCSHSSFYLSPFHLYYPQNSFPRTRSVLASPFSPSLPMSASTTTPSAPSAPIPPPALNTSLTTSRRSRSDPDDMPSGSEDERPVAKKSRRAKYVLHSLPATVLSTNDPLPCQDCDRDCTLCCRCHHGNDGGPLL